MINLRGGGSYRPLLKGAINLPNKLTILSQLQRAALRFAAYCSNQITEVAQTSIGAIDDLEKSKQDKLTGTAGQVVGFDDEGNAGPVTLQAEGAVTIKRENGTLAFSVPTNDRIVLQRLEIAVPPDKTVYHPGEIFDPSGMVVTAIYTFNMQQSISTYTVTPDGPLPEGTDKVTISYTNESGETKTVEQPISVKGGHIYGVSWDGTGTTKWTRTDEAAMFTDPIPYIAGATEYGSPFDNLMPWAGMVKEERTGGTMVAIPKFWYRLTQNGAGMTIQISDMATPGFSVSPAHMDRGDGKGERDVVYIGRYHCGSDYKSVAEQLPKVSITRAAARTEIHKLGENIWQSDFAMQFTIWLLYLVEFADWNSQKCIGCGCGNGSEAENMGYTDSMPYHTGTTQSSRDIFGLGTQYRNIEGLWDNVYDWCDNCYNNDGGLNIILNPNNYSDTSGGIRIGTPSSGWPAGFTVSNAAGFPVFYASKAGGYKHTYSCDSWGFDTSSPCVYVGGNYDQHEYHGLFCVSHLRASSVSGVIGSRLQELP